MKQIKNYFANGEPSIFVITSPFQVLCTYSAIKNLKITDYLIIVVYAEIDIRKEQVFTCLDYFQLEYIKFKLYDHVVIQETFSFDCFFRNKHKAHYSRAFLGDYRDDIFKPIAFKYLKRNSAIIYLDDGNSSLIHFQKLRSTPLRSCIYNIFFSLIAHFRSIYINKYYYTIYSDISTKMVTKKNNLNILITKQNLINQNKSFFIGTSPDSYTRAMQLSHEEYLSYLETTLKKFKELSKNTELYFIPHGKDKYIDEIKIMLKELGFQLLKLNEIVEIYLTRKKITPVTVAGFMSTALYTIKQLSPQTRAIGFMTKKIPQYEFIANYYKNHDIDIVYLK